MKTVFKIDNLEYSPDDLLELILGNDVMPYKYSYELNMFYVVDDFGSLKQISDKIINSMVYINS